MVNKQLVLDKLGLNERSALNILADEILCNRILAEPIIHVKDAISKYKITRQQINSLINSRQISFIKNTKHSLLILFENEIEFFSNSHTTYGYGTFTFLSTLKNTIIDFAKTPDSRGSQIFVRYMQGETIDELSKSFDISYERILTIIRVKAGRIGRMSRQERTYEHYKEKNDSLKLENERLLKFNQSLYEKFKSTAKKENLGGNYDEFMDTLKKRYSENLKIVIEELDISVRLHNILKGAKMNTLGDIITLDRYNFLKYRHAGEKSYRELKDVLEEYGLKLKGSD